MCAERDADAELVGALRDGVGDDAVEADCGEGECEEAECAEEPGDEVALLPLGLVHDPVFEVLDVAVGLLIGIDRVDLEADGVKERERRDVGADEDLRIHAHAKGIGG